jgi:hypothetical protein
MGAGDQDAARPSGSPSDGFSTVTGALSARSFPLPKPHRRRARGARPITISAQPLKLEPLSIRYVDLGFFDAQYIEGRHLDLQNLDPFLFRV